MSQEMAEEGQHKKCNVGWQMIATHLLMLVKNADWTCFIHIPLVPSHNWSNSNLNVNRTFPPALLYMPVNGKCGSGSFTLLMPGNASSGFPYLSNTFLCCWKIWRVQLLVILKAKQDKATQENRTRQFIMT